MRAPDHNLQPQNAARSSLAQPCLRARPGVTSAEFNQVFGYGGGGSLALKKPTTAGLNSRWNAARSKPVGSRQISGANFSAMAVQGARKAKWPAFGTT